MDEQQFQLLHSIYQSTPQLFSLDEVDQLEKTAAELDIPFQRNLEHEQHSLLDLPKQLLGGFTQGLTAFIDPFQKPRNTEEQIAHELGSVVGFVGGFFVPVGKIAGASIGAIGTGLKAAEVVAEGSRVAGAFEAGARAVGAFKSVPLTGAELIMSGAGKLGAGRLAQGFLEGKPVLEHLLYDSQKLGIASGISALHGGLKAGLEGYLSGSVYGGVFAGIGNIPGLSKPTTINKLLKAAASSVAQGLPATYYGSDTSQQIYDYMLGGVFGYHAQTATQWKATELLMSVPTEIERGQRASLQSYLAGVDAPESVKDEVLKMSERIYTPTSGQAGFIAILRSLPGGEQLAAQFNLQQLKVGDTIQDREGNNVFGEIVSKNEDTFTIRNAKTKEIQEVKAHNAELIPSSNPATDSLIGENESASQKASDQGEDFNSAKIGMLSRTFNFARTILGETALTQGDFVQTLSWMNDTITRGVKAAQQGGEGNVWEGFKTKVNDAAKVVLKRDLTDAEFDPIKQYFNESLWRTNVPRMFKDSNGKFRVLPPIDPGSHFARDVDGNRFDMSRPTNPLQELTGDNMVYFIFDQVEAAGGMKRKLPLTRVAFSDPEWQKVFQAAEKSGYYLYGGNADKAQFLFVKYNATPEEAASIGKRLADAGFEKDYEVGKRMNVEEKGLMSAEEYDKIVASNLKYIELLNGGVKWEDMTPPLHASDEPFDITRAQAADSPTEEAHLMGQEIKDDPARLMRVWKDLLAGRLMESQRQAEIKAMPAGKDKLNAFSSWMKNIQFPNQLRLEALISAFGNEVTHGMTQAEVGERIRQLKLEKGDKKAWIGDVLNFNKRQQPVFSDMYPVNPEMTGRDSYSYILSRDPWEFDKRFEKENTDGGVLVRDDVLKALLKSYGLSDKGGFAKPFFLSPDSKLGLLIGKMAFHAAGAEQSAEMEKNGLDFIVYRSSAKQYGLRRLHDVSWKDGKLSIQRNGKDVTPSKYTMQAEHIRMSGSIYDQVEKIGKRVRVFRQIMTNLTSQQVSKKARDDYRAFIKSIYTGKDEANKALAAYLAQDMAKKNPQAASELLAQHVDDFGWLQILDGMKQDKSFREAMNREMLLSGSDGIDDGEVSGLTEDVQPEITADNNNPIVRFMEVAGADDASVLSKFGRSVYDQALSSYFVKRITNPKVAESGNAIMRIFDPELAAKLKLDDNSFFLDEGWRALKVGKSTLGELYDELSALRGKILDDTAEGRNNQTRIDELEKQLKAVVARVPMDDISGAKSLLFSGFTGRQGGGIVISAKNMRELGGADNDIDKANFHFSMPESLHEALVQNDGAQAEYRKQFPYKDRLFFQRAKDLPLFDSRMGMLDPYHRAKIGHEVSTGRGRSMGISVANRFNVHSLYSASVEQAQKEGSEYAEFSVGGGRIRLYPRQDNGLMLRAFAQSAINDSADVGNEGGLVDPITMRAIMLHAAFDRIDFVDRKGNLLEDIIGNSHTDAVTPDLADEDRRSLSDGLMEFSKSGVFKIDEFTAFREVGDRLYGYNYEADRPYTRAEKVMAAAAYPEEFDQPFAEVAHTVAGMGYQDSLLDRFLPHIARGLKVGKEINLVLSKQVPSLTKAGEMEPLWQQMFPFLKKKVGVPFAGLAKRLEVIKRYSDFNPNSWATQNVRTLSGREELASHKTNFDRFLDDWAKASGKGTGKEYRAALLKAEKEQAREALIRDGADQEAINYTLKRMKGSLAKPDGRLKFLNDVVEGADSMLFTRYWDIASIKALNSFYRASGLGVEFAQDIIKRAADIRAEYATFWKQRAEEGRMNDTAGSYDKIMARVKALKHDTQAHVQNEAIKGRIIDGEAADNFVEASILSSLTGTSETQYDKLGMDIAKKEVLAKFAETYSKAFSLFDNEVAPGEAAKFIQEETVAQELTRTFPSEKVHHTVFVPKAGEMTPKDDALSRRAIDILHSFPNDKGQITAENFFKFVRRYYNVAQISDLTSFELRGLVNLLESWKRGPGWVRWLGQFFKKPGGETKLPFKWWHALQFVETTADEWRASYLDFYTEKALDEQGNLKTTVAPLEHINTETGRLEHVFADTAIPMTHFHRVIQTMRQAQAHLVANNAFYLNTIRDRAGYAARPIVRVGGTEDEGEELWTMAVMFRQLDGAQASLDAELAKPRSNPETVEKLKSAVESIKMDMPTTFTRYDEIKAREYQTSITGAQEKLTGADLIARMKADQEHILKEVGYDQLIKLRDEWIKDNIVHNQGLPDVAASFKGVYRLFSQAAIDPEKDRVTFDEVRLMSYLDDLVRNTTIVAKDVRKPALSDVKAFQSEAAPSELVDFKELFGKSAEYVQRWTKKYLEVAETGESKTPPLNEAEASAITTAKLDFKGKRIDTASLRKAFRYFGYDLSEFDFRRKVFGMKTYSQYEHDLAFAEGRLDAKEHLVLSTMDTKPFRETGYLQGYWPHMNWDAAKLDHIAEAAIEKLQAKYDMRDPEQAKQFQLESGRILDNIGRLKGEDASPDGFLNEDTAFEMVNGGEKGISALRHLDRLGERRPSNTLRREENTSGYSTSVETIHDYFDKLNSAIANNFAAFQSKRIIADFEARRPLGEDSGAWSKWLRLYVRDGMGYPTLFPENYLQDPRLKLQQTPYYWLSDHAAFIKGTRANKIASKLLGLDRLTGAEMARLRIKLGHQPTPEDIAAAREEKLNLLRAPTAVELEKMTPEEKAAARQRTYKAMELWAGKLKGFANFEARYEMVTLLSHTKTVVANMLGGNTNTWVYTGSRFWWNAFQLKKLQAINPEWKSMEDVKRFVSHSGAIEEFIVKEGNVLAKRYGAQWSRFTNAVIDKLKGDPEMDDATLFGLAKKHGISDALVRAGAYFMTKSERELRTRAFLSSYLQARAMFEPMNKLPHDTPFLIDIAKKGIAATQFLYDTVSRPAFARTNLGKVYSRFKLWAWSSVKFQRQVIADAASHGWRQGTVEFERYQRLVIANTFAVGLASLLPYTIFDNSLAAPMSYFQNLADWMFGNKKERERAFYAGNTVLPSVLAPLNELMPSIGRIPKGVIDLPGTFGLIWGHELSRLGEYSSYSLFPFGRLGKDVFRAYDNPEMAADWLAGLPLHAIAKAKKAAK